MAYKDHAVRGSVARRFLDISTQLKQSRKTSFKHRVEQLQLQAIHNDHRKAAGAETHQLVKPLRLCLDSS